MPHTHDVAHEIAIDAPADTVYRLLADVGHWPVVFPPTVHVECLETSGNSERIQLWATANGDVKTWTSRRELDPGARRIGFRQDRSTPPVAAMGGTWLVEPIDEDTCRVRLEHDYSAVDDDPAGLDWIAAAVDTNSGAELAALKANAELSAADPALRLTFEDTVPVDGSVTDAYDFVNEAHLWRERLPHVARVSLREDVPGLQLLAMDTETADGSTHSTTSVRVTFPHDRIVYKQIQVPALMTLHTGVWTFQDTPDGGTASSRHTVVINKDTITDVLGPDAGVATARAFVHDALSANSKATLGRAAEYARTCR